jgi:Putative regulator of cell autolysis
MNNYFKEATLEIKKTRTLTGAALATAFTVVIDFFRIVVTQSMEITFGFLGIVVAGMLYGPVVGGLVGAMADVIGYVLRPTGPFFFGFTFNNIVSGVIYGLFLYKKEQSLKRFAAALLTENIIVILILTPMWLNIMYGTSLFAIARVIRCIVLFPIKLMAMNAVYKAISVAKLSNREV